VATGNLSRDDLLVLFLFGNIGQAAELVTAGFLMVAAV
jgi:hypothetical protein